MKSKGLIALVVVCVLIAAGVAAWPSIPGTLTTTADGKPWGSGTIRYYYQKLKQPCLVEHYRRGVLVRSEWYNRVGVLLLATDWEEGDGGDGKGLFLRQDGSIKVKLTYRNYQPVLDQNEYFDPLGLKVTAEEFKAGELDNWGKGGEPAAVRDYFPTEPD